MIMFEKFGQHQPLNRQAERYALEGVPIALSTMADAVGSVCTALDPLLRRLEAHVMAAERLHADDTTVPVLAKGKTDTGRCWIYVRDDRPFGGAGPPAAMFYYSRDRKGEHPQAHLARHAGILQADAYDGYNQLYLAGRRPGPIREAACWVHARRPFFAMADIEENARRKAAGKKEIPLSPIAIEVVRRIDALFEIERSINGKSTEERLEVRQTLSRPLVEDLQVYMRERLAKLSRGHDLAKASNYILKRWASFTLFLEDGRVCLSNNAAERGLRGIALGRKSWLFCGSDRGGRRAAAMYSLIVSALCRVRHRADWTKPLRGRQRWRRPEEGSGTECAAVALTILRCASRRPTRGLAEQVAGDVDYRKTSPFFRVRFKICLHKNLDGLLTGINFDTYRRVVKLHFISATILSSDNRVRHFYATSGPAS